MLVENAIAVCPIGLRWAVHKPSVPFVFEGLTASILFSVFRGVKLSEPSRLSLRAFMIVAL